MINSEFLNGLDVEREEKIIEKIQLDKLGKVKRCIDWGLGCI